MGPPAKRRRLDEPEDPADFHDVFDDDYDSDDELTLADLDPNDRRLEQALLVGKDGVVDQRFERRQLDVTTDIASTVTVAVELGVDGEPTTTVSLDTEPTAFATDLTDTIDVLSTAVPTISVPALVTPDVSVTTAAAVPITTAASNITIPSTSLTAFATISSPFNGTNCKLLQRHRNLRLTCL